MLEAFKSFYVRFSSFGGNRLPFLLAGGIVSGLFEIMGVALVFPLIAIVNNKEIIQSNNILRRVSEVVGLSDPVHFAIFIAVSIGLVFVVKNLFLVVYQFWQFSFLTMWKNKICEYFMMKYLSAPYRFHISKSSSEIINNLSSTVYFVLNSFVLQVVLMVSNFVIFSILLGFLLYKFFFPAVVSGGILLILSYFQSRYIKKMGSRVGEEYVEVRQQNIETLQQSIGAIRDTKMLLREKYFFKKYQSTNSKVTENDKLFIFFQYLPPIITEIVLILTIITMCCLVLIGSDGEGGAVSSLAVLAAVAFRAAPTINRFLFSLSQVRASINAARELVKEYDLLVSLDGDRFCDFDDPDKMELKNKIIFDQIKFSYSDASSKFLLDIPSLEIKKGEFVGVVGESGAGKTSLVDLLIGLNEQDEGRLLVDNEILSVNNIRSFRKNIGYVHQSVYLVPGSIFENVCFGRDHFGEESVEKVITALKRASLFDLVEGHPDGLKREVGENGKNLSGGQRQRIGIARALYNNPDLLILDEATSALDMRTENEISEVISDLKGHKTILAIAHRLSTLKRCDKIIYMSKGKILDVGTFQDLSYRQPSFKELLKMAELNISASS